MTWILTTKRLKKEEKRNMLNEIQKNKFTARVKEEAKKLLLESKIEKFLSLDDSGASY